MEKPTIAEICAVLLIGVFVYSMFVLLLSI